MIGRCRNPNITRDITREERIFSIKESIKVNEALISYYTDLINPEHSTCSFQIYLRGLDKKAEAIKAERRSLIASFDKASNGEILSLQRQNIELVAKLIELRGDTPAKIESEARRMDKKFNKVQTLREKLSQLEDQLKVASQIDVEELLKTL